MIFLCLSHRAFIKQQQLSLCFILLIKLIIMLSHGGDLLANATWNMGWDKFKGLLYHPLVAEIMFYLR